MKLTKPAQALVDADVNDPQLATKLSKLSTAQAFEVFIRRERAVREEMVELAAT